MVRLAAVVLALHALAADLDGGSGGQLQTTRLKVQKVDHIGMNVPNMDMAIRFFSELFGARTVLDVRPQQVDLSWKRSFRWHESSRIERIAMLKLPAGDQIELFEYSGAEISRDQPHEDDAAATHIAFFVQDIDDSYAIVKRNGLRILCEPMTLSNGSRWFYFLTPWNSQLELVTAPRSAAATRSRRRPGSGK